MGNLIKLEALKVEVQSLWKAIEEAADSEKPQLRERYRSAYEAYKRQRIWCEELALGSSTQLLMS